jgi:hypothetical protein
MKSFGQLKSSVETLLTESFIKKSLNKELKNFKKLVLENKNITKLFFLYDELNSKKGLKKDIVDDYINECIKIYENTINKISPKELTKIQLWVESNEINSENKFSQIDNLLSSNILTLESKIESRNVIKENLQKTEIKQSKEIINLPISTMVQMANKTIENHIKELNESEKKELIQLLSQDDKTLNEEFNKLQESVISKLNTLKESTEDNSIKTKIEETLSKVSQEKYDKLNFFKLKNLSENL